MKKIKVNHRIGVIQLWKLNDFKIINYSGHCTSSVLRHLGEFSGSEFEDRCIISG